MSSDARLLTDSNGNDTAKGVAGSGVIRSPLMGQLKGEGDWLIERDSSMRNTTQGSTAAAREKTRFMGFKSATWTFCFRGRRTGRDEIVDVSCNDFVDKLWRSRKSIPRKTRGRAYSYSCLKYTPILLYRTGI